MLSGGIWVWIRGFREAENKDIVFDKMNESSFIALRNDLATGIIIIKYVLKL